MIDQIFDWRVGVLVYWANIFGITCREANVWTFVIIWPILTVTLLGIILMQHRTIHRLSKE